jgi:DNA-binding transcriptional regulator GbsR (MarR family)
MMNSSPPFIEDRENLLGTFGALFQARGMGEIYGRVFGALILSADAMTQDQISEYIGYSVPAVSGVLDELIRLGLVQRSRRQSSRKYFYTSKVDLDAMFRRTLQAIHDEYVMPVLDRLEKTERMLQDSNSEETQQHLEIVKRYQSELKDLKKYLEKLLGVKVSK